MTKIKRIGIIAEDQSDFDSLKILIGRITKINNLSFRPALSKGCGNLKKKALGYSNTLHDKGCNLLIIASDLDKNNLDDLEKELKACIENNPFPISFICIPIKEIEAWFLSDPIVLKKTFRLKKIPKVKGAPENIACPKKTLGEYVYKYSEKQSVYLNTKHNSVLSDKLDLDVAYSKCSSFKKLYDFIGIQNFA